jgi:hypothetical protein
VNLTMMTRFDSLVRRRGGAVILALFLVACDTQSLLEVPDPDVGTPVTIEDKAALPAVLGGAVSDFGVAYNGTGDSQISMSALFTDELIWAETFPTRFEVDVRSVQVANGTTEGVFRNLHRARISALRAVEAHFRLDPGTNASILAIAEALNLEGMTYIYFGENYCNGVPFSRILNAVEEFGSPKTNVEMFNEAIVRFDSSLKMIGTLTGAAATGTAAVLHTNFAKVGRGRAYMDLDDPASAVLAVAGVPTNFVYNVVHSTNSTRQNNGLFNLVFDGRRFGVGQLEGVNGLPFRTDAAAGDVRIPNARGTGSASFGFDGTTALFVEQKYGLRDSPAPVINGTEARLIEAEADMRVGGATWIPTLNTLRTGVGMAGTLTDPGTQTAREDLFFKEREYWLWLTAHRLGDMRRLLRQYGRAASSVYPTGNYFKGGLYGTDVQFPIPFDEKNNPNFVQCTDRNP